MRHPTLVLGYHGCDRDVAEKVFAGQATLKRSENDYDWLGHGIYFWEDDPLRARQWAEHVSARPKVIKTRIIHPAVVGAIVDRGECLDLTNQSSLQYLAQAYEWLSLSLRNEGKPLPKNESAHASDNDALKRKLDCAVINYLHQAIENASRSGGGLVPFDTVRCPFWEGEPVYPGARFMAQTHVQLCVRHERSILGYFRPPL